MTKYAFLARLEVLLAALEADERTEALRYYEELFEDNAEAAQTLRTPEEIAAELLASYGIEPVEAAPAEEPPVASPACKFPVGKLVGAIALGFLVFVLGVIACGTACAAVVLFISGGFLFKVSTALAITMIGIGIFMLGLFGLSLGGTLKSGKAVMQLYKKNEGGESA